MLTGQLHCLRIAFWVPRRGSYHLANLNSLLNKLIIGDAAWSSFGLGLLISEDSLTAFG